MDKYPLVLEGRTVGELTTMREGLYTRFTACCQVPEGLWCAWAVGDAGELRLGVLEPRGGQGEILRRFSDRMTGPLGNVLRGEVRPAGQREPERWREVERAETVFRSGWLRQRMRGVQGVKVREGGGWREVAVPWRDGGGFPLETLFCFARVRMIGTERYAVFRFDGEERPVF